jgi:uncharacterized protein
MGGGRAGVFVDSSGWIALCRAQDSHHRETEALIRRALGARIPLVTTSLVVAEVHRFVLHRTGIRAAAVALERIVSTAEVRVVFADADHDREGRRWLARLHDQPITYTDAVSFAVMKAERLDAAISFDRHFVVAGFRAWRV